MCNANVRKWETYMSEWWLAKLYSFVIIYEHNILQQWYFLCSAFSLLLLSLLCSNLRYFLKGFDWDWESSCLFLRKYQLSIKISLKSWHCIYIWTFQIRKENCFWIGLKNVYWGVLPSVSQDSDLNTFISFFERKWLNKELKNGKIVSGSLQMYSLT